jgi:hypothetical protein
MSQHFRLGQLVGLQSHCYSFVLLAFSTFNLHPPRWQTKKETSWVWVKGRLIKIEQKSTCDKPTSVGTPPDIPRSDKTSSIGQKGGALRFFTFEFARREIVYPSSPVFYKRN